MHGTSSSFRLNLRATYSSPGTAQVFIERPGSLVECPFRITAFSYPDLFTSGQTGPQYSASPSILGR